MSWMTYYVEVSRKQHEDELRRRLNRPRTTPERIPRQRSESWRRLWGRPWTRLRAEQAKGAGRTARRVTPAGR